MKIRTLTAASLLAAALLSPGTVVTEFRSEESEKYLWEILSEEAPNEYVASAILAYFWRESSYRSDAVTHWANVQAQTGEDPGKAFTEKLDSADRDEFVKLVRGAGGYGLGQWYSKGHLESLYDFCKGSGTSFADAGMQCRFAVHSCVNDPYVWDTLKNARNAQEAGKIIGYLCDGAPEDGAETIASIAKMIYREHHNERNESKRHD